jgi:hypothetical protein
MPGEDVGDAYVEVHADASGLTQEIQRAAEKAAKEAKTEVTFTAKFDKKQLQESVQAAAKAAEKYAKVTFSAKFDSKDLRASVKAAALQASGAKVRFQPEVLVGETLAEMRRVAAEVRGRVKVRFGASIDPRQLAAAAKVAAAEAGATVHLKADLDTGAMRAQARVAAAAAGQSVNFNATGSGLITKGAAAGVAAGINGITTSVKSLNTALPKTNSGLSLIFKNLSKIRLFGMSGGVLGVGAAALLIEARNIWSLVGSVVALSSAVATAAAGTAISLVGSVAALGVAAAVTKVGLTGVSAAVKAYNATQEEIAKNGKASKATLDAQAAAFAKIAPNARDAVAAISGFGKSWTENVVKPVQQNLFGGDISKDIRALSDTLLPALGESFSGVATTINDTADDLAKWATSEGTISGLQRTVDDLNPILQSMFGFIGGIGRGLGTLFADSLPSADRLADKMRSVADNFADWANQVTKSGAFRDFLDNASDDAHELWTSLKDVGSIIGTVFAAGDSSGLTLLKRMNGELGKFSDWLKSAEGQQSLANWFAQGEQAVHDLYGAIKFVAKALKGPLDLGGALADSLSTVFAVIGKISGAVDGIADAFTSAIPQQVKDSWLGKIGSFFFKQNQFEQMADVVRAANKGVKKVFGLEPVKLKPTFEIDQKEADNGIAEASQHYLDSKPWDGTGGLMGDWPSGVVTIPSPTFVVEPPNGADLPTMKQHDIDEIVKQYGDKTSAAWAAAVGRLAGEGVTGGAGDPFMFPIDATPVLQSEDQHGTLENSLKEQADALRESLKDPALFGSGEPVDIPIDANADLNEETLAAGIREQARVALQAALSGQAFTADAVVDPTFTTPGDTASSAAQVVQGELDHGIGTFIPPAVVDPAFTAAAEAAANAHNATQENLDHGIGTFVPPAVVDPDFVAVAEAAQNAHDATQEKLDHGVGTFHPPAVVDPQWSVPQSAGAAAQQAIQERLDHVDSTYSKNVSLNVHVNTTFTGGLTPEQIQDRISHGAKGFVVTNGPQVSLIGEAGPEALVPLNPHQAIRPEVRQLLESVAASRGIGGAPAASASDTPVRDISIEVNLPTGDPEAAAMSVMNRLASRLAG